MDKTKIRRTFSESFKRQIVSEIDSGKLKVCDVVERYGVTSANVYIWLKKYSLTYTPTIKMVVELETEAQKTLQLSKKVAELERIVGQKQLEIDFLNTLVKVSSEELGTDLRKVFFTKHLIDSPS